MRNETFIILDTDWLMKKLIISAMRYDAYRSSYVVSDLTDIALLIHRNRDKFNADRVEWLARDLRETASQRLAWLANVNVEDEFNDRNKHDAYNLIAQHLEKNTDMRFCDYDWEVDCLSGDLIAHPREEPLTTFSGNYLQSLYDCDIATIVTAANILDTSRHCIVASEYEGRRGETLCFTAICAEQILDANDRPTGDYSYRTQYKPVDRPNVWLCDEYIKQVKLVNPQ